MPWMRTKFNDKPAGDRVWKFPNADAFRLIVKRRGRERRWAIAKTADHTGYSVSEENRKPPVLLTMAKSISSWQNLRTRIFPVCS